MSRNGYVARSSRVAARRLGDELLVMSVGDSASLFSLNKVAAILWESADGVTPLEEIVRNRICPRFDIAPDTALKDAQDLVERLAGHGIVQLSETPISPTSQKPR